MRRNTKRSIVQADETECFLCGKNGSADRLEKHHIFGAANRNHSEEDGLFVYLCGNQCHRNGPQAAHRSANTAEFLHKAGQRAWELKNGSRAEFRARYGKNYLEDE